VSLWKGATSLILPEITSAFLAFVDFHQVLSDEPYCNNIKQAVQLALAARDQLVDAKAVEDRLCLRTSWNRACWTVWGGQYGGAERGGMERETCQWPVADADVIRSDDPNEDDGGWELQESTS
jgi:hypothetical protein